MITILIRGGELETVIAHLYENASFGSHDKLLLVCRGLLSTYQKVTMNSNYEFIVATAAIFILCIAGFSHVSFPPPSTTGGGRAMRGVSPCSVWVFAPMIEVGLNYSRNQEGLHARPSIGV
jgi:hypothetical protein